MNKIIYSVLVYIALTFPVQAFAIPAFPGAVGFGSNTPGGRGGSICLVTSLADTGANTFRDCVTRIGPRIIVFGVSGQIVLETPIIIKNPFVTIAAQTAPGDGILLRKDHLIIATHDVVVRNLRVRVGDEGGFTNNRDGINISTTHANSDVYNIIVDHSSVSWGIDENISTWMSSSKPYKTRDITIQHSIISEALHDSIHVDEGSTTPAPHSMGALLAPPGSSNISFHNNILAHNGARNPRLDGVHQIEVVNNVIYNWANEPTIVNDTQLTAHIVGNYYKGGANSSERDIKFDDNQHQLSRIFIDGNYVDFPKSRSLDSTKIRFPSSDQNAVILQQNNGNVTKWYTDNPPYFKSDTAIFPSELFTTSAQAAYASVLSSAGAVPRDTVDQRIVQMVINRTGSRIDSQNQVGGWPNYSIDTPPPADADKDGLPDSWEPHNPNDIAPSGYTWIEEYINSLIPIRQTTPKPADANGDGRVDGIDYVVWLTHLNQAVSGPANGDFNNSGTVDGVDYVIWLNNYGL